MKSKLIIALLSVCCVVLASILIYRSYKAKNSDEITNKESISTVDSIEDSVTNKSPENFSSKSKVGQDSDNNKQQKKKTVSKICTSCNGTGDCKNCGGSGRVQPMGIPCPNCLGSGKCKVCKGKGTITRKFTYDPNAKPQNNNYVPPVKVPDDPSDCPRCHGTGMYHWNGGQIPEVNGPTYMQCRNCGERIQVEMNHDCICKLCGGLGKKQ